MSSIKQQQSETPLERGTEHSSHSDTPVDQNCDHDLKQHNVDPQEIQKFNELAERWWDPTGEFKPLHEINPLRVNFIEQQLLRTGQGSLAGKRVIDIGCGGGILTEAMRQRGALVTGVDMGERALNVAIQHAAKQSLDIEYRHTTVEEIASERPEQYDVVTCLEMLEHVPDPASVILSCAALCKPGGQFFFSTINRNPKAYLFAVVGAEYILKLLPKGTHDYDKFIRPSELSAWIRQAKLSTGSSIGLHYNPITQHYSLKPDVSVNYIMHATKPNAD